MNKLSIDRRAKVVSALVEGNSIRATCRMTGTAKWTVIRLLANVDTACSKYQSEHLVDLTCNLIQCDEVWSFCYAKQKNVPEAHNGEFGYGDVWTFTAIDADTKLVPCWKVGTRDLECAYDFVADLRDRLANRVQISTDGHKMYLQAVEHAFGSEVDFAQLVKLYGQEHDKEKRYSPAKCIGAEKHVIQGNPDVTKVSTSYVERQNLTMRMSMRRFTRLTNAFSKKLENHIYALALYFMHYNFVKLHKSLANPYPATPAMAAGISTHIWTVEEIVSLVSK